MAHAGHASANQWRSTVQMCDCNTFAAGVAASPCWLAIPQELALLKVLPQLNDILSYDMIRSTTVVPQT